MSLLAGSGSELQTAGRFLLVGALAAGIHLCLAAALLATFHISPMASNVTGFLVAVNVSFLGHHRWSFKSQNSKTGAYRRFFITTTVIMLLNNLLLACLLKSNVNQMVALFIAGLVVVPFLVGGYFVNRFWVFRKGKV